MATKTEKQVDEMLDLLEEFVELAPNRKQTDEDIVRLEKIIKEMETIVSHWSTIAWLTRGARRIK